MRDTTAKWPENMPPCLKPLHKHVASIFSGEQVLSEWIHVTRVESKLKTPKKT